MAQAPPPIVDDHLTAGANVVGVSALLQQMRQVAQEERQQMQALLRDMDDKIEAKLAAQEAKMVAREAKQEATLAAQEAKQEAKLAAQEAKLTPREAITTEQLETLQLRLERMHEAGLLLDTALEALEDCIADYVEVRATLGVVTVQTVCANEAALLVHKLIALGEALPADKTFARQCCRKFVK